jgi:hypothetical protein
MLSDGKGATLGLGMILRATDGFDISLAFCGDGLWLCPIPLITGQG